MMGVCGKDGRDYIRLVDLLGIYYQIRDDYMNVKSSEYNDNKGYFEDITEGKFSFLIIYAMKNPLYQGQLLSIMRQKTQDPHVKKYAASLIEQSGAFGYAVNRLQEVESQIYEEIEKLGGNERLVKVVQYLSREFH
ncbi:Geranylgeranyl pyrophosphate synthase [Zancudomyces culisetae]|uniref:Geranylgeranyl pyrophosphate synthase n=1 Tax=Zancudomyces culisetae TaxID=1213189 RepID=A0A1R1PC14_ZANCU|nr:Geranylgeranyl pyrophosphate synthase [Zancudomyces culisetae]|eukprot:OMH78506.1 Geranylgeranyl pyrophosphate synthase [Zancudomyces culisetae]